MSRRIQSPISYEIVDKQRQAADPRSSIWVAANAGSGKTHVLVERVLRLLLSGVSPESILCLTYTKAAAAVMRDRVSRRLGKWALLDDTALDRELLEMEGTAPSPEQRRRARTLFAHALETPGGLKIVTIHAFCESVLHRFPLEAKVPFDFSVIEDVEKEDMILRARETVLAGGLKGDPAVAQAVETLFELMSDFQIGGAIDMALAEGRKLRPVLADRQGAKARLRRLVGTGPGRTRAALLQRAVDETLFPPARYAELFAHVPPDPARTKNLTLSDKLWALRNRPARGLALFGAFLKDDGEPYKDRATTRIKHAGLAEAIGNEHDRLADLFVLYKGAALIERSEALLDVLGAISDRYEAEKRARSLLDFDDLIERLGDLLQNEALGPWVQYKLDAGITHILVDESQDTNAEQWAVVRALASEFFVGDSAVERPRTLFAVGDEKQSIYSFQGADPALFGQSGRDFQIRAKQVDLAFDEVRLLTSFRTLRGVLDAVDTVFARADIREAVLAPPDAPVLHHTARAEEGGLVTLWPPIQQKEEDVDPDQWPLEAPKDVQSAPRQLAEKIADEIRNWLDSKRPLGPRGRAVRADDILILVQSRSMLFGEIIRALVGRGIPTPGADRLAVTSHIGVLDLLALGDVLLNPADDLQLAALLRSPLFDISEEDLFDILQPRPEFASAWQALEGSDLLSARTAFKQLHRWRGKLDFERPYEFFAEILYADGGLRNFHARLGTEVDDVFAEFLQMALAHEQTAQPSLQGFLAALRARDVSIKRELAESGGGVRVMTVHGAKGLEAPIVILADATSKPQGNQLVRPVIVQNEAPGPLLIHASGKKAHVAQTLELRDADERKQRAEYWRKLYVGMTRAEDELYITGALTRQGRLDGTWYEAVETTLRAHSEIVLDELGGAKALIYPRERPEPTPVTGAAAAAPIAAPPLSLAAPPKPVQRDIVRPSSAFTPADRERVFETRLEETVDAEAARKEGTALHALLQHLGKVTPANWPMVIDKVLLPESPSRHAAIAEKAVSILTRPDLAGLFAPNSRAEVPFLVDANRNGVPIRLAGRIDRLVVDQDKVLVVDYKSDSVPPTSAEAVPQGYLTQLGLYALVAGQLFPGLAVESAILWTRLELLMILPAGLLANATSGFTMR
jgi:ATP-dependent helicase/nuclease subunit A